MPAHAPHARAARRKLSALAAACGLFAAALFAAPAPPAAAQLSSPGVRISQIYTRGGEPGAAYTHDFVELFNPGPGLASVNGWKLHMASLEGNVVTTVSAGIFPAGGGVIEPGGYFLIRLAGGANGQPLPAADADLDFGLNLVKLGSQGGRVALLRMDAPDLPAFTCPQLPAPGVVDYVGYGTVGCFEGSGAAAAPSLTTSAKRLGQGCVDTDNNAADFAAAAALPRNSNAPPFFCDAPGLSVFNFAGPQVLATEADHSVQVVVTRAGDLTGAATVDYATADGTAVERRDYTTALGTLRFAPGEQSKTFDVLLTEDAFVEGIESLTLTLSNATGGAALGLRSAVTLILNDGPVFTPPPTGNTSDLPPDFVRQHYHDFLNRAPDAGGLQFWTAGIESCATAPCVRVKRVDTSAAFFLSIEFQETGYFVYRLYKASLPAGAARPRGLPRYREFVRDTQEVGRGVVVGADGWQQRLAANRRAFLDAFVARPEFEAEYPLGMPPADYVVKLNSRAGGVLSVEETGTLIAGLIAGAETRASVLGRVADHPSFARAETNRAFVLMQYFGYLRRNPTDPPDANFDGYDFWLGKLEEFGGDWRRAEMVRAFIESIEYRQRFGQ